MYEQNNITNIVWIKINAKRELDDDEDDDDDDGYCESRTFFLVFYRLNLFSGNEIITHDKLNQNSKWKLKTN